MPRANIKSIDAIESFRTRLIIYSERAAAVLDEAVGEASRARAWLSDEQVRHWQTQVRRCEGMLADAKQALLRARLSGLRDSLAQEKTAVRAAENKLEYARGKLDRVKLWVRRYESDVVSVVKRLDGLRSLLASDLPKGIAELSEVVRLLHEYADMRPRESDSTAPRPETSVGDGGAET